MVSPACRTSPDAASRSSTPRINTTRFACSKVRSRLRIVRLRQPEAKREQLRRRHAGLHGLQVPEAPDQQAGADEQHQRDRDLGDDQRVAQAGAHAAGHALAGRLQVIADVGACRLQRRTETDEQADDHRGQQGEQEHASVHADVRHARQPVGHETQQQIDAPQAGQEPGGAAGEGEHPSLGEHARHHPPAGRAECALHGDLALTRHRADQQQVRGVRDGDQHHEADAGHQHQQRRPHGGDEIGGERMDPRRPSEPGGILVGVLAHQLGAEALDSAACGVDRRPRADAPDRRRHEASAVGRLGERRFLPAGRRPHLDIGLERLRGMPERRRHHPDDFVDVFVDAQLAAEDLRIPAEAAPPQRITDHRHGRDARDFVAHRERAAQRRPDAEQVEVIGARQQHLDALRAIGAGEVGGHRPDAGDRLERTRPPRVVLELRLRKADVAQIQCRVVRADPYQRAGVRKRQRLQQHAVDDGVDRGRGRKPDRQRTGHRQREQRTPPHPPHRQPHILQQSHSHPPSAVQSTAGASGSRRNPQSLPRRRAGHARGVFGIGQGVGESENLETGEPANGRTGE